MAGYIGNKSQTLVDGYSQAAADAEFVNDPNSVITVDASGNVGIGTSSPAYNLHLVGTESRIESSSTNGVRQTFDSTSTNGRAYQIGSNFVTGTGEFSVYDATASAERMRIDSAGRVTMPYQPAFHAMLTGAWTHPSGVQLIGGEWGTDVNVGSHYNISTRRFTAPVSGTYAFNVIIAAQGNTGGFSYLSPELWVNGSRRRIGGWGGGGYNSYGAERASYVTYLSAGDYVEVAAESSMTFNLQNSDPNNSCTQFSGHLIG